MLGQKLKAVALQTATKSFFAFIIPCYSFKAHFILVYLYYYFSIYEAIYIYFNHLSQLTLIQDAHRPNSAQRNPDSGGSVKVSPV